MGWYAMHDLFGLEGAPGGLSQTGLGRGRPIAEAGQRGGVGPIPPAVQEVADTVFHGGGYGIAQHPYPGGVPVSKRKLSDGPSVR